MGKKGGSSWLSSVVKRAFRSPTKDDTQKKTSRRREENDQELDEEEKKREKRRWLFRKPSNNNAIQNEAKLTKYCAPPRTSQLPADQRHAIAVAAATAAAAEAAVATAQAAVEIIRLTRSSNPSPSSSKQNYAAIIIQTAFRGYLARRALVALRGIVKLQALIRGQNVRKQAKITLRCMQALLRLQTRMQDHQSRLSQDGGSRMSMFVEATNLWESKYLGDIRERKSISKDRKTSNISVEWSECPRTLEELEAALQARNKAISKRETSLAHAFSQKIWNPEKELGESEWMATKQCKDTLGSRVSNDKRDSNIKTVEMDTMAKQCSPHSASPANVRKFQHQNSQQKQGPHLAASPSRHKTSNNFSTLVHHPPLTPSPSSKANKPSVQVRTSSPRCLNKEDKSYSAANTPSLRSMQRLNSSSISRYSVSVSSNEGNGNGGGGVGMPNYMAATESAKARVRSQSAPRQRPSTPTPERERGGGGGGGGSSSLAKKRLSFPVVVATEAYASCATCNSSFSQDLRSPSFKSVQAGYVGMEQQSNQSCYTDSLGGEISPCSTTDLRRWLR